MQSVLTFTNMFFFFLLFQLAVFIVPSSAIPMFLLSGFFLSPKDLTDVFQALSYLSYFKYAFEGAVQSIFGYNRDRLPCSQPYCHYRSLCKFIKDLGMADFTYWDNIAALVAWIVLMQFSLYFVLKWRLYNSKNTWHNWSVMRIRLEVDAVKY